MINIEHRIEGIELSKWFSWLPKRNTQINSTTDIGPIDEPDKKMVKFIYLTIYFVYGDELILVKETSDLDTKREDAFKWFIDMWNSREPEIILNIVEKTTVIVRDKVVKYELYDRIRGVKYSKF